MNLSHIIIGLVVGVGLGAIDFSFSRSMAAMIRPSSTRAVQAVLLGGFIVRLGLIGVTLLLLSRSGGISFSAVCVGLVSAFTILTIGHAIKAYSGTVRIRRQASGRR